MKKSIIAASAASLALAAMPVVSTFAATKTVTDNLSVTIDNTCTLLRSADASVKTVTSSSWANDAGDAEGAYSGTYTAHMDAGTNGTIGTSTFTVTCNDSKNGHTLTVAAGALSAPTSSTGLSEAATINYTNSSVVPGSGDAQASGWNITTTANATLGVIGGIVDATSGSATLYPSTSTNKTTVEAQTFTATYKVGAAVNQTAGTYTGSAVYTLTYGAV